MVDLPHFAPKARRVIYLFPVRRTLAARLARLQTALDRKRFGQEVPKSVYPDERKTTMSNAQSSFATAPSLFEFQVSFGEVRYPQMSELLRETRVKWRTKSASSIRCTRTAINHDPGDYDVANRFADPRSPKHAERG